MTRQIEPQDASSQEKELPNSDHLWEKLYSSHYQPEEPQQDGRPNIDKPESSCLGNRGEDISVLDQTIDTDGTTAKIQLISSDPRKLSATNLKKTQCGRAHARRFSRHITDFIQKDKETAWKTRQLRRQQLKLARNFEASMKQEQARITRQKREQRRRNEERRKENDLKSGQIQIIKNTSKIRKWTLKARRTLAKVSEEVVERLTGRQ